MCDKTRFYGHCPFCSWDTQQTIPKVTTINQTPTCSAVKWEILKTSKVVMKNGFLNTLTIVTSSVLIRYTTEGFTTGQLYNKKAQRVSASDQTYLMITDTEAMMASEQSYNINKVLLQSFAD